MVSAGVFLTVLLYSVIQGAVSDMVDSNARFETGYLRIMTKAYNDSADQMPNDLALLNISGITKILETEYPDIIWTPRIKFGGLIDIPDREGSTRIQGPVFGIATDLTDKDAPDISILNLKNAVTKGALPREKNEILISETYAEKLGITVGDTATVIASTMYGSMSMANFKITGLVRFGMVVLDRNTIIADIEDVRDMLDMKDGASEILGFSKDRVYDDQEMQETALSLNKSLSETSIPGEKGEFAPVVKYLGEQGMLKLLLNTANTIMTIIFSIFVFAMSIVLWNSGLMNGIRRYGEIGIRLAIGEPKGEIYRSMILESVCIGLAGSVLGTAAGLGVSYWMQYTGIDFGSMMQKYTIIMSSVFRARVTWTSYFIGFLPGVFASLIGTLFAGIGIYRRQTSQLFRELEV